MSNPPSPEEEEYEYRNTFDQIADAYIENHYLAGEEKFELACGLWMTLERMQKKIDVPDWKCTDVDELLIADATARRETVLLTAEYTLFKVYSDVELPRNPFLHHLVETYTKYRPLLEAEDGIIPRLDMINVANYLDERVHIARFSMIKYILLGMAKQSVGRLIPQDMIKAQPEYDEPRLVPPDFSTSAFLSRVAWEGSIIWTDADALAIFKENVGPLFPHLRGQAFLDKPVIDTGFEELFTFEHAKAELQTPYNAIVEQLMYVGCTDIKRMDYVAKVLTWLADTSEGRALGYDVPSIFRDYLQSCLRQMENLGREAEDTSTSGEDDGGGGSAPAEEERSGRGVPESSKLERRQRQKRAAALLVLLIRYMVKYKGFVEVGTVAFEIRELAMQYIWVPEVREFKKELAEELGDVGPGGCLATAGDFGVGALADGVAGLGIERPSRENSVWANSRTGGKDIVGRGSAGSAATGLPTRPQS